MSKDNSLPTSVVFSPIDLALLRLLRRKLGYNTSILCSLGLRALVQKEEIPIPRSLEIQLKEPVSKKKAGKPSRP